jgi:hypothetical protein
LLTADVLAAVTPEFGSVALAIGDEDSQGVAVHVNEPTSNRAFVFVFTDALADGKKFARGRPAMELQGETCPSVVFVVFIDGCPLNRLVRCVVSSGWA